MTFEIRTTPKFERLFKRIPEDVQERVTKRILDLAEEPYQGKTLHGKLKGKILACYWGLQSHLRS